MLGAALINVLPEPRKLLTEHGNQMLRGQHVWSNSNIRVQNNILFLWIILSTDRCIGSCLECQVVS